MNENNHTAPPDHAEAAFRPPILLAVLIVVGFLARWIVAPLEFLPANVSAIAGPILTIASIALFAWASRTM